MEFKDKIEDALLYHKKENISGRDVLLGDKLVFKLLDENKNNLDEIKKLYFHFTHELEKLLPQSNEQLNEVIVNDEIDQSISILVNKINSDFARNEIIRLVNSKKKKLRTKMMLKILSSKNYFFLGYVELIHLASLIQDDVIDKAVMRRFEQTINDKYDDRTAIIVSDILIMTLMNELASYYESNYELNDKMYNKHYELLNQMIESEMSNNVTDLQSYYKYSENKTANLFALCLANSYYIENNKLDKYDVFYKFGLQYGIIFQIVDDFIDNFSSEKKTGKTKSDVINKSPNYYDFVENKSKSEHINDLKQKIINLYDYEKSEMFKEQIDVLLNIINEEI